MLRKFERDYALLIEEILLQPTLRKTRNANTKAVFGRTLVVPVRDGLFPLIQGRKMWPEGVKGEFAAMVRRPTCVADFEKWGCNYWKDWADKQGNLNLDYGNAWFNFNGVNQIQQLKYKLANNPYDRRMIVSGWKPDGMNELSLPCCHHTYQFFVTEDRVLHMSWSQRSVDTMVGLPSDIVFAAAWLISLAREFNFSPGDITMFFGDCHIYEPHFESAETYLTRVESEPNLLPVHYEYAASTGTPFELFKPEWLILSAHNHFGPLKLELIA